MAMNFDEEVSPHSHTDGSHGTWLLSEAAASENAEHNEEAVAFLEKMWQHHNHITDNSCAADVVGYTALHHAVRAKDLSAIRKLLQYSDERFVNKEGNDCSTALRIVCKNFTSSDVHEDILQEVILVTLLDAGANPNLPQKYRFSLPLMHALKNHWWRGVELLLDAGAKLTKDSYERCKPPDSFFTRVNVEIILKLMMQGCAGDKLIACVGDKLFTNDQFKKLLLIGNGLDREFVTMDLVEAAICAQYHDCVMYLLVHYPVLALRDDFLQFINNLFVHTRGCDWNYKKRYLSAMTTCISKVHSMRQPKLMFKLIQMCFQYCPRAAHDEVDCDGACRQLECKIALKTGTLDNLNSKTQTALELRVAAVKHLFQMIELHALPIELWIYESRMSRRDSLLDLHLLSECSRNEINLLIFLLYNLTVGSIPLFLQLLPVFKRRGFKLTASCLTTFIMNDNLVEYLNKALKLSSPDLQAVVHDRESPYRILLSELTRNCCLDGECWFRSYVLQDACARALLVGARIPLLMMLHLGVHDISPSSCNVRIGRSPIGEEYEGRTERKADKLSPSIEFITHRYAPRFSRKMKMMAFGRVKFEQDDYNHSYFSEETSRYRAPEAPLRSLQELCRLSIRASLGHCRIEEKTEGLRDVLPQPLREYLYFRHDFLVFPEAVD